MVKTLFAVLTAFCLSAVLPTVRAQEIYGQPDAPLAAEVLGTKIHTGDPDEMQYVIIGKLLDRYAVEQGVEVSQEEIDAYIEGLRRTAKEDQMQKGQRRDELAEQMKLKTLTDAKRKALSLELDTLSEVLQLLDETAEDARTNPEEVRAARERVATAFIRQWEINRALYKQYGGRIIFQQGGPEPLDAYRKFLEAEEKKGAFTILNKAFEPEFWKYYVTDTMHSFYPEGSKEEARAFETPWWLMGKPQGE